MEDFLISINRILEFKALFTRWNYILKYGHKEYNFLVLFPHCLKQYKLF